MLRETKYVAEDIKLQYCLRAPWVRWSGAARWLLALRLSLFILPMVVVVVTVVVTAVPGTSPRSCRAAHRVSPHGLT